MAAETIEYLMRLVNKTGITGETGKRRLKDERRVNSTSSLASLLLSSPSNKGRTNRRELGFAHLLKFALSLETVLPVWGPSDPSNVMIRIEVDPFLPKMLILVFVKLQSIIVDQDIGRASLELVCTDGLFDRFYCWGNNPGKALLVHRALDGDMGEWSGADTRGRLRRIVL